MKDSPQSVRLPSISEWLREDIAPIGRAPEPPRSILSAHARRAHPYSPPAPRLSPLTLGHRPPLHSRRSHSPFSNRGLSATSISAPPADTPQSSSSSNSYIGRRRSSTDPQLVYRNLPLQREDKPLAVATSRVGTHGTFAVHHPHNLPRALESGTHVFRHGRDGSLELIPPGNAISGSSVSMAGSLVGDKPLWQLSVPNQPPAPIQVRSDRGPSSSFAVEGMTSFARSGAREPHSLISFPVVGAASSRGGYGRSHLSANGDSLLNERSSAPNDANRRHLCHICGSRFNRPSSLKIHINKHTGETPFRCPWPNCGREFNVNSNMRRHLRNHSNPGSSRRAGERGGQRQRRRRESGPIVVDEATQSVMNPKAFTPALDPHRSRRMGGPSDSSDALAPPISTLSLWDGSLTSPGTSDAEDDYRLTPPNDADEEDELSDDEIQHSAKAARNQHAAIPSRSPPSTVSSPSLSACSSRSLSSFSRRSSSLSPPPSCTASHRAGYSVPVVGLSPLSEKSIGVETGDEGDICSSLRHSKNI